jgi:hypothetical protein
MTKREVVFRVQSLGAKLFGYAFPTCAVCPTMLSIACCE